VDLPRGQWIVLTGPSGSGKSSLAFDTIHAEGQRRFLETLSSQARQVVEQLARPDVDELDGLPPTLAVPQYAGTPNPRSTVATLTEIHDYLRLLWARVGEPFCPRCGAPIRRLSPEQIQDLVLGLPEGTKFMLLAPLEHDSTNDVREITARVRKAGLVRVRIDGAFFDLESVPNLDPSRPHVLEAVVDRLVARPGLRVRLGESLRLALKHGRGTVLLLTEAPGHGPEPVWSERSLCTQFACPACGIAFGDLEPRSFSSFSPLGACPACQGLGKQVGFVQELVLPDSSLSLARGAVAPWRDDLPAAARKRKKSLSGFLSAQPDLWTSPLKKWNDETRETFWRGNRDGFPGLAALLRAEYDALGEAEQEPWQKFLAEIPCHECQGTRLRPESRAVLVGGRSLPDWQNVPLGQTAAWFRALNWDVRAAPVAEPLVAEVQGRLAFLEQVGLGYLTLDRAADTLSGGELQRIRLATHLGAGLVGVCYVLDEPSRGLHPQDNERLIVALRGLQQQGNTVLLVEHDEALIRAADLVLDLGPGSGPRGGRLLAQGTPEEIQRDTNSPTGKALRASRAPEHAPVPRPRQCEHLLRLEGVATHNLQDIDVDLPLGRLVCVTGVSGSGKSSLIQGTLAPALRRFLRQGGPAPGPLRALHGAEQIDRLVQVDQAPLGRSPRSNAATYTGIFEEIRKLFASTKAAKIRGFAANRFSFNVAGGRCETCQGQGLQKVEMHFLADLWVPCPDCRGRRFNRATLEIPYHGKSIAEVLELSIGEALSVFADVPLIRGPLQALVDVGLDYLTLGQPATTLSGGEAQRVKLAAELGGRSTGRTLYLLDEPTSGLHFQEVSRLLGVLQQLVEQGNTVLLIEHHLDVLRAADWIIDLGPGAGPAGGQVTYTGLPAGLASLKGHPTGRYLTASGLSE